MEWSARLAPDRPGWANTCHPRFSFDGRGTVQYCTVPRPFTLHGIFPRPFTVHCHTAHLSPRGENICHRFSLFSCPFLCTPPVTAAPSVCTAGHCLLIFCLLSRLHAAFRRLLFSVYSVPAYLLSFVSLLPFTAFPSVHTAFHHRLSFCPHRLSSPPFLLLSLAAAGWSTAAGPAPPGPGPSRQYGSSTARRWSPPPRKTAQKRPRRAETTRKRPCPHRLCSFRPRRPGRAPRPRQPRSWSRTRARTAPKSSRETAAQKRPGRAGWKRRRRGQRRRGQRRRSSSGRARTQCRRRRRRRPAAAAPAGARSPTGTCGRRPLLKPNPASPPFAPLVLREAALKTTALQVREDSLDEIESPSTSGAESPDSVCVCRPCLIHHSVGSPPNCLDKGLPARTLLEFGSNVDSGYQIWPESPRGCDGQNQAEEVPECRARRRRWRRWRREWPRRRWTVRRRRRAARPSRSRWARTRARTTSGKMTTCSGRRHWTDQKRLRNAHSRMLWRSGA